MNDTMNPHRRQYRVWMIDHDATTLEHPSAPPLKTVELVTVTYADQLRGELEGRKLGLGSMADAPMHYATVWVWAALVRTGRYTGKFGDFKATDLGELEPIPSADELSELGEDQPPADPS